MSWQQAEEPRCEAQQGQEARDIEMIITPRQRDLGDFSVRRVLPAAERRLVGPFIFFDHMGPADFPPGKGINVRPHPHIGLSTVTYLFEGEILHRDSLGYEQPIRPGAINLMTAGSGIVHSERTAPGLLESGQRLHGIQTWMALPVELEEIEPAFEHVPADVLPTYTAEGISATLIFGRAFGLQSPVTTHAETLYMDLDLAAGARLALPEGVAEMAIYTVEGTVSMGSCPVPAGSMGVLRAGRAGMLEAGSEGARAMLIGGQAMGERHVWWNFVSSRRERIEQGKRAWKNGDFGIVPGDAEEFIPLPE
jgi:redox-sensitive bicupin YhaK (pirin superfamily)